MVLTCNKQNFQRFCFTLALIFCLTPLASPAIALALGLVLALAIGRPESKHHAKIVKYLLQCSVVGLGFGLNFSEALHVGKSGIIFTMCSIVATLGIGYLIGRMFKVRGKISFLICVGTAICGGSAIAAVAPIIEADEEEVAVSLGTIFILNAIALFIFPFIGHYFEMTFSQFGFWSAISIHDTSSVVGAAAQYGEEALKIATTVKLTRALWIVPIVCSIAFLSKKKTSKIAFPYFILGFVAASLIVSFFPSFQTFYHYIVSVARQGLTVTLFLIGTGFTKQSIKQVGLKPVMQGVILWILVSSFSLWIINFWVS